MFRGKCLLADVTAEGLSFSVCPFVIDDAIHTAAVVRAQATLVPVLLSWRRFGMPSFCLAFQGCGLALDVFKLHTLVPPRCLGRY